MALSLAIIGTRKGGKRLYRFSETGSANTQLASSLSVTTNNGASPLRLISAHCAYSNTPTQAGVTTALDSGAGAGYDTTLNTGSANSRYTNYYPASSAEVILGSDDGLVVTAPAGGVGITASVVIYAEDA